MKWPKSFPIWFVIIIFTLLYSIFGLMRHYKFGSHAFDLGIFAQAFDQLARFQKPVSTIREIPSIFADHFHPIIISLVPFYWIWSDPKVLLILQSFLVALAGYPLFLISRRFLENTIVSLITVVGYLIFIGTQNAIGYDFHEIAFFPFLFLFTFWLMIEEKWLYYFIFLFLTLMVKENLGLVIATLGIGGFFYHKNYKITLFTVVSGIVWFWVINKFVLPISYLRLYPDLGNDFSQIIKTIFLHPFYTILVAVNSFSKIETIVTAFFSFGWLPLFSPRILFISLPLWAEKLLVYKGHHLAELGYQYGLSLAPLLSLGTIFGILRVQRWFPKRKFLGLFLIIWSLITNLLVIKNYRPTPLTEVLNPHFYQISSQVKINHKLLKMIPPKSAVSSYDSVIPHLIKGGRRVFRFPEIGQAEYIFLSSKGFFYSIDQTSSEGLAEQLKIASQAGFKVEYQEGEAILLKREMK